MIISMSQFRRSSNLLIYSLERLQQQWEPWCVWECRCYASVTEQFVFSPGFESGIFIRRIGWTYLVISCMGFNEPVEQ